MNLNIGRPANATISTASAYPAKPVRIRGFYYSSNLYLTRKISAVQRRTGEDACYALAQRYTAWMKVKPKAGGMPYWLRVSIPFGFLTDLASIPHPLRWFAGRVGPHLEASVVHDWLYAAWQFEGIPATDELRQFADLVFLAAMKEANVRWWRRWPMFAVVRLFGESAFKSKDRRILE